jgi:hypothetical protein
MATDTLSRVTKQTFHRASPDRLGEEPYSLSLSKAPNKRVMFRRPWSRTLYAFPSSAVKQLLMRGARRGSEAKENSPFQGPAALRILPQSVPEHACCQPDPLPGSMGLADILGMIAGSWRPSATLNALGWQ